MTAPGLAQSRRAGQRRTMGCQNSPWPVWTQIERRLVRLCRKLGDETGEKRPTENADHPEPTSQNGPDLRGQRHCAKVLLADSRRAWRPPPSIEIPPEQPQPDHRGYQKPRYGWRYPETDRKEEPRRQLPYRKNHPRDNGGTQQHGNQSQSCRSGDAFILERRTEKLGPNDLRFTREEPPA